MEQLRDARMDAGMDDASAEAADMSNVKVLERPVRSVLEKIRQFFNERHPQLLPHDTKDRDKLVDKLAGKLMLVLEQLAWEHSTRNWAAGGDAW